MPRTAMTVRTRPTAYAILPLDLAAFDTFDNANGMTLPVNGRIEVIIQNTTVGALTVTFASQNDPYGRKEDITAYSVAAGHFAFFQEFPAVGWATGGLMNIDASGALSYVAIQRAVGS